MWSDISLLFWFAFPWRLMILTIFSCWSSIYFLWKNVYSLKNVNFSLGCLYFLYQVLWDICIFWILIPYQIHPLQIICPISVGDLFILLSFLVWKHLFWCSLICLFLFVFSLIEDIYPKNIAETDVKEQITYVFYLFR